MKWISFKVEAEPKGKGRPRFNTRTGKAFTPKDTITYENKVRAAVVKEMQERDQVMLEGNIIAKIVCFYSIPKSASKKDKANMLLGNIRPSKNDLDNVAKAILDGLNNVAYKDDRQVVELHISKFYAEVGCVDVELWGE